MRDGRTRHGDGRARQLLLVALTVALSGTGCAEPEGGVVTAAPLPAQASEAPPLPSTAWLAERPAVQPAAETQVETRPTPPSGTRPLDAAVPVRIEIPAIDLDSDLVQLGLETDGTLEVPPAGFPAGWYHGSPTPGQLGPAIVAGHVDWGGRPGVFFDLRELSPGDAIAISRQDGSVADFEVTRIQRFDKSAFPTQEVYGDLDHAGLRLITCGGDFDAGARSYTDNLIVFAELASGQLQ